MFNNNDLFLVLLVTLCASTPARAEALPEGRPGFWLFGGVSPNRRKFRPEVRAR